MLLMQCTCKHPKLSKKIKESIEPLKEDVSESMRKRHEMRTGIPMESIKTKYQEGPWAMHKEKGTFEDLTDILAKKKDESEKIGEIMANSARQTLVDKGRKMTLS